MLDTPWVAFFVNWSGLQTPLFLVDSAQNAPHPLFYEGKWWSADPVIYRGSEMGGQLSSSGHAKNALLELQIHTLPRNLSHNNSAGPLPVGAGGVNHLKENPGPEPFPGKTCSIHEPGKGCSSGNAEGIDGDDTVPGAVLCSAALCRSAQGTRQGTC